MTNATDIKPLRVSAVGTGLCKDDLPDGPFVVLTGDREAVRAAALFFGDEVELIAARKGDEA